MVEEIDDLKRDIGGEDGLGLPRLCPLLSGRSLCPPPSPVPCPDPVTPLSPTSMAPRVGPVRAVRPTQQLQCETRP